MKSRGDFPRMSSKVVCISNISCLMAIQVYFQTGCFLIMLVMFFKKKGSFSLAARIVRKVLKKLDKSFMKSERFFEQDVFCYCHVL